MVGRRPSRFVESDLDALIEVLRTGSPAAVDGQQIVDTVVFREAFRAMFLHGSRPEALALSALPNIDDRVDPVLIQALHVPHLADVLRRTCAARE